MTSHLSAVLAILLPVLLMTQTAHSACTKILRWNDDVPFSYLKEPGSDEVIGLDIDMVREAMRRIGCEVKLIQLPWARALEELKNGRIDLVSGAYKTPEREAYAHFSTVDMQSPNILFYRTEDKDKWQFKNLADLIGKDFQLGVQIGVTYSTEYDRLKKLPEFEKNLVTVNLRSSLWQMLNLKRIDGVIADEITGMLELKELGLSESIIPSPLIVSNDPVFYAFSKKTTDAAFVATFNGALQKMHDDGTSSSIRKKYLQ